MRSQVIRITLYMNESEQLYPEQPTTAIIVYHREVFQRVEPHP